MVVVRAEVVLDAKIDGQGVVHGAEPPETDEGPLP